MAKKVLSTAIWSDKKWAGFLADWLGNQINSKILKGCINQYFYPEFSIQFRMHLHKKKIKEITHDLMFYCIQNQLGCQNIRLQVGILGIFNSGPPRCSIQQNPDKTSFVSYSLIQKSWSNYNLRSTDDYIPIWFLFI